MLFLFLFLFSFPSTILSNRIFIKLPLPKNVTSPYSFAFDQLGGGPYTGVTDGRIFKYGGPKVGFTEFAFTAPNRSKEVCDGTRDINLGPICGRPLGLGYDHSSNQLYIADAYFGLLAVGSNGGPATQAATSAEGVPFRFLSGLDVDPVTGTVYITDFSTEYELRDIRQALVSGNATVLSDTTGRAKQTNDVPTVGTALSTDRSFILVTQFNANRIQKFWFEGTKASTAEILVGLEGSGLDVDPVTGTVYITDFSTEYELRDIRQALVSGNATVLSDTTGRLLKYDPRTSQVNVLLRNLSGAVSVGTSFVCLALVPRLEPVWRLEWPPQDSNSRP
eukprot:XP_010663885.1 PREDICTED: protein STRICTOSIDINE SYNTHASE-LIKE 12-like [Vitis vinifera]